MAPRGAKKRSQTTGGGKGNAIFPPLQQSAAKAWAGVADSEFDLRVLCKGKYLKFFEQLVANRSYFRQWAAAVSPSNSSICFLLSFKSTAWPQGENDWSPYNSESTLQVQTKEGSWVEVGSPVDLLILDEVTACHLKGLLCLLYNGFADVTLDSAAELKDVWEHLGVDIVK